MTDTVEHDGIPIFGPMLEAGLYDPTDAPHDSSWLPYNNAAAELACCLEACKQVTELAAVFAVCPHPPASVHVAGYACPEPSRAHREDLPNSGEVRPFKLARPRSGKP
jgi:hypothetical protein